jgi:hypothetical protein
MYMKMIESMNAQINSRKRSLELARATGNRRRVSTRQVHLLNRISQRFDSIRESVARRHRRAHRNLSLTIETIDSRRTRVAYDPYEVIKSDKSRVRL